MNGGSSKPSYFNHPRILIIPNVCRLNHLNLVPFRADPFFEQNLPANNRPLNQRYQNIGPTLLRPFYDPFTEYRTDPFTDPFTFYYRYTGKANWKEAHMRYLRELVLPSPAQKIFLEEYLQTIDTAVKQVARFEEKMLELLKT